MVTGTQGSAGDRPRRPELVFGLVGALGVDMDAVQSCLAAALRQVEYEPHDIRITDIMRILEGSQKLPKIKDTIHNKIARANAICSKFKNNSILAALAISEIREIRRSENIASHGEEVGQNDQDLSDWTLDSHAYIIRQLKRVEEIELLRTVYRKKFVQVSVALDKESRITNQKN
jgi:hypothetical protein